ncbi:nuclear transport factor 2 family protein [Pseudonocardia alaniniphila]|uniref:Nuclear transport factor 2 family protein n=1 Tax=Pseudonocardia alaniniphila TaxID=75291 RepID=A0ABS9T7F0_9PSEU|nr:nuclear transport factor 2 family protein [Pseudonocardia alaniniphila]MCH6164461.1 nuclear transport factor 2 family protein [Pseudonocardia alaniniphila]
MTQSPTRVLDRYIGLADKVIADPSAVDELVALFAPDAVVQLDDTPVTGPAIREMYCEFVAAHAESRHFWNTTVLPDGTERATWVVAARMADGSLMTAAGVEHARLDDDGRIVELRNEYTRRPG